MSTEIEVEVQLQEMLDYIEVQKQLEMNQKLKKKWILL